MRIFALALTIIAFSTASCRGQQPNSASDLALAALVDSLMPQLEQLAGLKKLRPITMNHQSRDDLRQYVAGRL